MSVSPHTPASNRLRRIHTDEVTQPLTLPVTGAGCPEIDALPEFLQSISRELFQHSLAAGHQEIFQDTCNILKENIPETECPYRPYTIAWPIWFRGGTRGFTEGYIDTVVNENICKIRQDIACAMLNHGFGSNTVMKMTGLTEDDLAQIRQ